MVTVISEIAIAFGKFLGKKNTHFSLDSKRRDIELPDWIAKLLNDKVQIVPAVVSEQAVIERQGNFFDVMFSAVKVEVLDVAFKTRG